MILKIMKGNKDSMTNEEIAVTLANHDNRIRVSEHRIEDLEESQKQIYDLTISVKELAMSVKSMVEEQKKQSDRIKKLEDEPGDNWNTLKKLAKWIFGMGINIKL